ncbi:transmembrane protein 184 homolog DDB_G0276041-like [Parasteatoda tepidariorum]|uniref:transmembrane protein 184 homolog DDB_G0276041-like n=1 Tax=Parasteatoda tepidariorum TaxID=114398 RepID=UPI00077FD496|nr:uncharacterized protein LOC107451940 [Parasteatoda tepidariorum]
MNTFNLRISAFLNFFLVLAVFQINFSCHAVSSDTDSIVDGDAMDGSSLTGLQMGGPVNINPHSLHKKTLKMAEDIMGFLAKLRNRKNLKNYEQRRPELGEELREEVEPKSIITDLVNVMRTRLNKVSDENSPIQLADYVMGFLGVLRNNISGNSQEQKRQESRREPRNERDGNSQMQLIDDMMRMLLDFKNTLIANDQRQVDGKEEAPPANLIGQDMRALKILVNNFNARLNRIGETNRNRSNNGRYYLSLP